MKKLLLLSIVATALFACTKDKFNSEPTVTINSFGPQVVNKVGQIFGLKATITDKEGDLQDTLQLVRKLFNGSSLLTVDTLSYDLSKLSFPDKSKMELEVDFNYGQISTGNYVYQSTVDKDRNLVIGIIVHDRAKHKSAYVETSPILLQKP